MKTELTEEDLTVITNWYYIMENEGLVDDDDVIVLEKVYAMRNEFGHGDLNV